MHPSDVADWLLHVPGWEHEDYKKIRKTFRFKDFAAALAYVDRLGAVAEEQDHHPDIYLAWGKVEVVLWTHKINGLSENDFIVAANADLLAEATPGFRPPP